MARFIKHPSADEWINLDLIEKIYVSGTSVYLSTRQYQIYPSFSTEGEAQAYAANVAEVAGVAVVD